MTTVLPRKTAVAAALVLAASACSDAPTEPTLTVAPKNAPSVARAGADLKDWLRGEDPTSPAPGASILVGAGDIAECYQGSVPPPFNETTDAQASAAAKTAELLDEIPGTVMTVGDNAYQFGTTFDYEACYDPTWGRHFDRTRPSAGNHEYHSGGSGYFTYYGPLQTNAPFGYYSYNLGTWHIIVLNSTPQVYLCRPPETTEHWPPKGTPEQPVVLPEPPPMTPEQGRACAGDVPQQNWLIADLAQHSSYQCTLVYFHHPQFSSGHHGNHYQMQKIWDILYDHHVDVVVAAHDHNYERFAPQDKEGGADPEHGIRQFVVGTGGGDLRPVGAPITNSEKLFTGVYGVIALALSEGSYSWAFVDVDRSLRDSGAGGCHGPPPA
jgi:hypothetical protein